MQESGLAWKAGRGVGYVLSNPEGGTCQDTALRLGAAGEESQGALTAV